MSKKNVSKITWFDWQIHTYYIIYIPNYETTGINDIADTKRVNCTFLSRVFAILNSNNSSRSLAWEIMRHNNTNKWLKISPRWSGEILINMAPLPLHTVFQKIYIWEQLINPTQKWNVILRTESSINWFCKKLISQNWFPKSKHFDWVIAKISFDISQSKCSNLGNQFWKIRFYKIN